MIFEVLHDLMRGIETISLGYLYFEKQCAFRNFGNAYDNSNIFYQIPETNQGKKHFGDQGPEQLKFIVFHSNV